MAEWESGMGTNTFDITEPLIRPLRARPRSTLPWGHKSPHCSINFELVISLIYRQIYIKVIQRQIVSRPCSTENYYPGIKKWAFFS